MTLHVPHLPPKNILPNQCVALSRAAGDGREAIGLDPSKTIAALAERIAALIVQDAR